jgi:hypothetical protein
MVNAGKMHQKGAVFQQSLAGETPCGRLVRHGPAMAALSGCVITVQLVVFFASICQFS